MDALWLVSAGPEVTEASRPEERTDGRRKEAQGEDDIGERAHLQSSSDTLTFRAENPNREAARHRHELSRHKQCSEGACTRVIVGSLNL